jgi:hypothetical protein
MQEDASINTNEDTLVALLLGEHVPRIAEMQREGVVPSFLAAKYAREGAALSAADLNSLSPKLTAALLRAAFSDCEEDVREAARHALILRTELIGDIVHLSLTLDADPDVRESAFDEALEVSDPERQFRLVRQAVQALIHDRCESVRVRAEEFDNGFVRKDS